MEITNKNVFITGSTRGIGLAIAHHFAAQGANLVLNGRSEISSELIGEFDQYDVQVVGVSGDVSDADDAKRMIQEATDALGSVDVLINNAGITADKLVLKMTADDFEKTVESGMIIEDDGTGYWATEDGISKIDCFTKKPQWATHVAWFNK